MELVLTAAAKIGEGIEAILALLTKLSAAHTVITNACLTHTGSSHEVALQAGTACCIAVTRFTAS